MADKQRVVKIIIIGPSQSGKTAITNYLANRLDGISKDYRPTAALRIVEFNREAPVNRKRPGQEMATIQLWDVSGDPRYEPTWPAIQKNAHGCLMIYNAENPRHEQEIEGWFNNFANKSKMPPNLLMAFAHQVSGKPVQKNKQRQIKCCPAVSVFNTSIEEGHETIFPAFEKLFTNVMNQIYENEDQIESNFMK
ncbi:hypothetical protein ABPG72_019334 [Tetrahymena utriculariae]